MTLVHCTPRVWELCAASAPGECSPPLLPPLSGGKGWHGIPVGYLDKDGEGRDSKIEGEFAVCGLFFTIVVIF